MKSYYSTFLNYNVLCTKVSLTMYIYTNDLVSIFTNWDVHTEMDETACVAVNDDTVAFDSPKTLVVVAPSCMPDVVLHRRYNLDAMIVWRYDSVSGIVVILQVGFVPFDTIHHMFEMIVNDWNMNCTVIYVFGLFSSWYSCEKLYLFQWELYGIHHPHNHEWWL